MVSEKPMLIVDLADSNGINTSSSGIGHRIEAWVNNSTQSTDLTDSYSSKLDNYRKDGAVSAERSSAGEEHAPGPGLGFVQQFRDRGNLLRCRIERPPDAHRRDELSESVRQSTLFTFRQNQTDPLNVTVKIYTVAGRLIQTLSTTSTGESFVRVPWDGRDRDGDILANGVYLYKVLVSTADGRFSSEALGKLSIVK